MIVNESEALARLLSSNNLINKLAKDETDNPEPTGESNTEIEVIEPETKSNTEIRELYSNRTGPRNIPPMIQTLAVETAHVTSERAAGETFGISHQTVNYYKNGGGDVDKQRVKENMKQLHSDAMDVMLGSIGVLKEKLVNREIKKATDLSKIAADMSRVIDKTTPKDGASANVKVIVFAPNIKNEDQYEEMVVNG